MKWFNLKQNKCPKCDKDIMIGLSTVPERRDNHRGKGQLLIHNCGFQIHEQRYKQIVSSQVNSELEDRLNKEYPEGGDLDGQSTVRS